MFCFSISAKFVLMPSGQVATMRCGLTQTLAELKHHFASELKIPPTMILFVFDGDNVADHLNLAQLGVGPNGTIQLEMQSADPVNTPLRGFRPKQEYSMPDVITVRVTAGLFIKPEKFVFPSFLLSLLFNCQVLTFQSRQFSPYELMFL